MVQSQVKYGSLFDQEHEAESELDAQKGNPLSVLLAKYHRSVTAHNVVNKSEEDNEDV